MKVRVVEYDCRDNYVAKFSCRKCGNSVESFHKFCNNCGAKLEPLGRAFKFTRGELCALLYMAANDGMLARLEKLRPGIVDSKDTDPYRCVHFFDVKKLEENQ